MASTNRTPYRAEHTPDHTDFPPDRDTAFSSIHTVSPSRSLPRHPLTGGSSPSGDDDGHYPPPQYQSHLQETAWRIWTRGAREVAASNTGLLLVGAAQFFFALMNVWVKKLNTLAAVPALELICVRMGITWVCCVAYMTITKVPDPIMGPKEVRLLLVLRGCFGFVGIFSLYYSLQYLSLSDATVLQFLAPIFTAISGAVLLREPLSWREAAAGIASLVGVALIARPEILFGRQEDITLPGVEPEGFIADEDVVAPAQRLLAVCSDRPSVALIGTLGATGAYTTIRAIGKRAYPLHNLVSYSTQCVVVTTIAMLALRIPVVLPTQWEWLAMLLLIGVFGFTAQFLLTAGLQRETAGRGTMAIYAQIVFAAIDEFVFFHTTPSLLSVVGTVIILASAGYVAVGPHF
ncbi:DUF6-domain-containing protein [Trametes versicolor FP-101664 SS1]|uniref:DUF6-domain-containing protein n=1 Tax=Trametes versicolor (strain FP-101664) TaxID=717944 RepID=UPI00046223F8|nr:DUF6-domain-containing protein [Trametes versicolor FP-101664 SS1]EIW58655.1 DUF6-domain-containing protein [Trametes versicolor FP-101664 SS1]